MTTIEHRSFSCEYIHSSQGMSPSFRNFDHLTQAAPTASVFGKLIISGEHAAVYGADAFAIPAKMFSLDVSLKQNSQSNRVTFNGSNFEGTLGNIIHEAVEILELPSDSLFDCSVETNIPLGAGLGASAAISVALTRALSDMYGLALSKQEIFLVSNQLEKHFHGSPSGLDASVVAFERPVLFSKTTGIKVIEKDLNAGKLSLIAIDSGARASTKDMIETARPSFNGPSSKRILKEFNDATSRSLQGYITGDAKELASGMNLSYELLNEIGVVSQKLEGICKKARELGCYAAKPTGAGGGGFVIGLCANEKAESITMMMNEEFEKDSSYIVSI